MSEKMKKSKKASAESLADEIDAIACNISEARGALVECGVGDRSCTVSMVIVALDKQSDRLGEVTNRMRAALQRRDDDGRAEA